MKPEAAVAIKQPFPPVDNGEVTIHVSVETLPPPSPGVQVTGSELEVLSTVDVNFTPESTALGVSAVKLTRSSVPFVVTFVRRVSDMVLSEELLS